MDAWRKVWREGMAPQFTRRALLRLLDGLCEDDHRIIQGATVSPPPLQCVQGWQVEGADPIAYAYWMGDCGGDCSVSDAEEFFARTCFECDVLLKEPAACRWFLHWWDDGPRDDVTARLAEEVQRSIVKIDLFAVPVDDPVALALRQAFQDGDDNAASIFWDRMEELGHARPAAV